MQSVDKLKKTKRGNCPVCELKKFIRVESIKRFFVTLNNLAWKRATSEVASDAYKNYKYNIYRYRDQVYDFIGRKLPKIELNDIIQHLQYCEITPMHDLKSDLNFYSKYGQRIKDNIDDLVKTLPKKSPDGQLVDMDEEEYDKTLDYLETTTSLLNNIINTKMKVARFLQNYK